MHIIMIFLLLLTIIIIRCETNHVRSERRLGSEHLFKSENNFRAYSQKHLNLQIQIAEAVVIWMNLLEIIPISRS